MKISIPSCNQGDLQIFLAVFNHGIDAYLEAFIESKAYVEDRRFVFEFVSSEIPLLISRLDDLGTEEASLWAVDIENEARKAWALV